MYDRKEVYEKHIKKRAKELNDYCKSMGIASFMTFCVSDNDRSTEYKNFVNGSISNGLNLSDDQIIKHINVANGFDTIPQENSSVFDEESPSSRLKTGTCKEE